MYDDDKGKIERICGDTYESIMRSGDAGEVDYAYSNVIAHPTDDNLVVVSTLHKVLFVDATTLRTVGMILGNWGIRDVTMCGDGMKCAVTTNSTCAVYDSSNIKNIVTITTCEMEGDYYLLSSDIHNDGSKVVCGSSEGVALYDITTSQTTNTLREEPSTWARFLCGCGGNNTQSTTAQPTTTLSEGKTWFVRFVYQPEGVLYTDRDWRVFLMNMNGVVLREFSDTHNSRSPTLINNNKWLVTGYHDHSIHIHDFTTGETLHRFYHPSSEGFRRFAYHSDQNKLIGVNENGTIFVLAANTALLTDNMLTMTV